MTSDPHHLILKILRDHGCAPESDAAAKSLVEEIQAVAFEAAAKVADALDGPVSFGSSQPRVVLDTERLTARSIAAGIRALKPNHAGEE